MASKLRKIRRNAVTEAAFQLLWSGFRTNLTANGKEATGKNSKTMKWPASKLVSKQLQIRDNIKSTVKYCQYKNI